MEGPFACLFDPQTQKLSKRSPEQPAAHSLERSVVNQKPERIELQHIAASAFYIANHDTSAFGEH